MEILAKRDQLLNSLNKILLVAERKSVVPILGCVKVEVLGQQLKLTATDLNIFIITTLEAVVVQEGEPVALSIFTFYDIIKKLPGSGQLTFKVTENRVFITYLSSHFSLPIVAAEQMPVITDEQYNISLQIPTQQLLELWQKTRYAMADDFSRPHLGGLRFEVQNNKCISVTTDIHRLSYGWTPTQIEASLAITLSRKTISEAIRLISLEEKNNIQIYANNHKIMLVLGSTSMISKLLSGSFPPYQTICSQPYDRFIKAKISELKEALERVSVVSSEKSRNVVLHIKPDLLVLQVSSIDYGYAREEVKILYQGPEVNITINARYLLEALSVFSETEVEIFFRDHQSPIKLTSGSNFLHFIMPMRGGS